MQHYDEKSTFYGKLPEVYDLFFLQNRDEQISYLLNVINTYCDGGKSCFDVGCGTGLYAERLAEAGFNVLASDLSNDMLEQARKCHSHKNVKYIQSDITNYYSEEEYDFAVALSHVIGYMWQNQQVEAMLCNINKSLKANGTLLLNFYHAPGVLPHKLTAKIKEASDEKFKVVRASSVNNNLMKNILEEQYYYIIEEDNEISTLTVNEEMRYYSLPEIKYFMEKAGFKVERVYNYLTYDLLTPDDWNGFIIAKKI